MSKYKVGDRFFSSNKTDPEVIIWEILDGSYQCKRGGISFIWKERHIDYFLKNGWTYKPSEEPPEPKYKVGDRFKLGNAIIEIINCQDCNTYLCAWENKKWNVWNADDKSGVGLYSKKWLDKGEKLEEKPSESKYIKEIYNSFRNSLKSEEEIEEEKIYPTFSEAKPSLKTKEFQDSTPEPKYKVGDLFKYELFGVEHILEITEICEGKEYLYVCCFEASLNDMIWKEGQLDRLEKLEEEQPELNPQYETHLWVQRKVFHHEDDGYGGFVTSLIDGPKPKGEGWEVVGQGDGFPASLSTDTDVSKCFYDERYIEDTVFTKWIRYRRPIPQKETYECLADYPLLMGGEG